MKNWIKCCDLQRCSHLIIQPEEQAQEALASLKFGSNNNIAKLLEDQFELQLRPDKKIFYFLSDFWERDNKAPSKRKFKKLRSRGQK